MIAALSLGSLLIPAIVLFGLLLIIASLLAILLS